VSILSHNLDGYAARSLAGALAVVLLLLLEAPCAWAADSGDSPHCASMPSVAGDDRGCHVGSSGNVAGDVHCAVDLDDCPAIGGAYALRPASTDWEGKVPPPPNEPPALADMHSASRSIVEPALLTRGLDGRGEPPTHSIALHKLFCVYRD